MTDRVYGNTTRQRAVAEIEQIVADVAAEAEARGRAEEREACARVPEAMIVGGRAWTKEQAEAAEMLGHVADNIRRRGEAEKKGGG